MSRTHHLERDSRRTDRAEHERFVRNAHALADVLEMIANRRDAQHAAEMARRHLGAFMGDCQQRSCPVCHPEPEWCDVHRFGDHAGDWRCAR